MTSLESDKNTPLLLRKRNKFEVVDLNQDEHLDLGRGLELDRDQEVEVGVDLLLPMPTLDNGPTTQMDPVPMTMRHHKLKQEVKRLKPKVVVVPPKPKCLDEMMELQASLLLLLLVRVEVEGGTMNHDKVDLVDDGLIAQREVEVEIGESGHRPHKNTTTHTRIAHCPNTRNFGTTLIHSSTYHSTSLPFIVHHQVVIQSRKKKGERKKQISNSIKSPCHPLSIHFHTSSQSVHSHLDMSVHDYLPHLHVSLDSLF